MNSHELLEKMSKMPPLRNATKGQSYKVEDSEVARWVMQLPGIETWVMSRVWELVKKVPAIKHNPWTGLWEGCPQAIPAKWGKELAGRPLKNPHTGLPPVESAPGTFESIVVAPELEKAGVESAPVATIDVD